MLLISVYIDFLQYAHGILSKHAKQSSHTVKCYCDSLLSTKFIRHCRARGFSNFYWNLNNPINLHWLDTDRGGRYSTSSTLVKLYNCYHLLEAYIYALTCILKMTLYEYSLIISLLIFWYNWNLDTKLNIIR